MKVGVIAFEMVQALLYFFSGTLSAHQPAFLQPPQRSISQISLMFFGIDSNNNDLTLIQQSIDFGSNNFRQPCLLYYFAKLVLQLALEPLLGTLCVGYG